MAEIDNLHYYLSRFRRWLRLRDGWLLAQRSLWAAALGVLMVIVAGRLWPLENIGRWELLLLAVWLAGVMGFSWLRPQPAGRVARRVDWELGLKERLSTDVALSSVSPLPFPPTLLAHQHQDALAVARSIDLRRALPLRWRLRSLVFAVVLGVAALALNVLPNPMDAVRAERAAVARAAEQQAQSIEQLRKQIEKAQQLSPEEREKLLRQLDELARKLRENQGDRAQALSDLSKMEESLRQRLDPQAMARQAALQALAAQLKSLAGEKTGEKADLSDAAEALKKLAEQIGELSPSEQQSLAQTLQQMAARAAQAGDAGLAQALASMAQAAQSGDTQAASQAAQSAADALSKAQSDLATQAALQQALSQLQGSRQAIAQAGQGQPRAQGSGQSAQGQGPSQGQGRSQGQGQPGSGGGTRANTLPPFVGSGQFTGRPRGQGQDTGVTPLESSVYVPWERLQGSGDTLSIPGQDSGSGETQSRQINDPLSGSLGPVLVPYQTAYYNYLEVANQAMEQTFIPPGLKDYVRQYFSQLEP